MLKIKYLTISTLLGFLFLNAQDECSENLNLIHTTIKILKEDAPTHEGASVNTYFIKDLNKDGVFEIIERSNRIEAAWMGFLNIEIYPAFEYDKIYVCKNGVYSESRTDISFYLEKRLTHYKFWRKAIQNPINLSKDSQRIISENKSSLVNEIDWIIDEINKKLKN